MTQMPIADFKNLIELQGLEREKAKLACECSGLTVRTAQLARQGKNREDELAHAQLEINSLRKQIKTHEVELAQSLNRLKDIDAHLPSAAAKEVDALTREKSLREGERDRLEAQIFEQMLSIEEHEKIAKEASTFLAGLAKTIAEISAEIEISLSPLHLKIEGLNQRIENLLSQIAKSEKEAYLYARRFHAGDDALGFVVDGRCQRCALMLDRMSLASVERGTVAENCSGCKRLLTPAFSYQS
jgi:predicted  nucleic acid-binding Zn-ribbon protein